LFLSTGGSVSKEDARMADFQGTHVLVSGDGKLYCETIGNASHHPVFLIHAGFLDRRMWDDQFELLASEGFWVIRYDMRGSGKSARPASKFSDANDLRDLFDHLKVTKASIVGVSNGGSVGIDFTLRYPERVRSLVLVAPTVNGYEYADAQEEKLDKMMEAQWAKWEEAIKNNRLEEAVNIHLNIMTPALNQEARAKIVKIALDNYGVFKDPIDPLRVKEDPPAFKRLSEIKIPTLLIWGDRDYPGQISLAERVQTFIPGSKKILIHGADHLVNLSQPTIFNRVLLNFLKAQKS
jgi:pimeloyl-ACP methyl ester carboxylesterase